MLDLMTCMFFLRHDPLIGSCFAPLVDYLFASTSFLLALQCCFCG